LIKGSFNYIILCETFNDLWLKLSFYLKPVKEKGANKMQTAIHSKMIAHEKYDYICEAGLNWFWPIKARPGEVLLINSIAVYNNSGANYGVCYKGIKHKGEIYRINYMAAINAGVVQRWSANNYITEGDEMGVAITPNAANETVKVTIQLIRFTDTDYDKLFRI